jgi:hypothetical protein
VTSSGSSGPPRYFSRLSEARATVLNACTAQHLNRGLGFGWR